MGLSWWPVALAGAAVLAGAVLAALLLPGSPSPRARRLAHVDRLTTLPEYQRWQRRRTVAALTATLLAVAMFSAAVVAAARPVGWGGDTARTHPQDVMLCVGAPAAEPATAAFFEHFARRAAAADLQRIGLTSPSARLIPLTGDTGFAAERLAGAGELGGRFSPVVDYLDYRTNVTDTLALCLSGFPSADPGRRRVLVYLGPQDRTSADPTLVTDAQVLQMAGDAGAQVFAFVPQRDAVSGSDLLRRLAHDTGGRSLGYRPDRPQTLTADLEALRSHHTPTGAPGSARARGQYPDTPAPTLLAAAIYALALCAVRAWVR